jgi:hypothetical protein
VTQDADTLLALLAAKHSDAVFVAECKTGSSWDGCRRLDAWALLKTWSPPTAIGYEVKVSRSDFLQDQKWPTYLPFCHELYFVCPPKLIAVEELPSEVGLMWSAGSRLLTKRKAVRREPTAGALVSLMSYVLMSRTRIVGDMWEANRRDPAEHWRAWLADREEGQRLGVEVSRRIRKIVSEARAAQSRAEYERDRLKSVEAQLEALGLAKDSGALQVRRQLGDDTVERLRQITRLAGQIGDLSGRCP